MRAGYRAPVNDATDDYRLTTHDYLVSLCVVCARHHGQNFFISSRSDIFLLFFVVL